MRRSRGTSRPTERHCNGSMTRSTSTTTPSNHACFGEEVWEMADINQIPVTVVQPGEGEYVALPGFGAVFKLSSRANGGEVSIVEHPFEVGLLTAAHRHTREDEHSIVLAGEIGFRVDDNEVVLGPRGLPTKPRGQMHAMWNAGSEPGRIIEVITPGGFENYFRERGELLMDHTNDPV